MMDFANTDDRWLDVDFAEEDQFILGALPSPMNFAGPTFEQRFGVIPEGEWPNEIEKNQEANDAWVYDYITRVYNQKSEGSCVSNATGQAHEIIQAKQFGRDSVIHLSAISLYKRCGRGPSSGSMLSTNLDEMKSTGILPLDNPENRNRFDHVMDNTGYYTPYPSGWKETAKRFRIAESYVVRSTEGLVTALLSGYPVVVGRSGHSICYCGVGLRSGKVVCTYVNSWGNWGFGLNEHPAGFGIDSTRYVNNSADWAFVVRSVRSPQLEALAA